MADRRPWTVRAGGFQGCMVYRRGRNAPRYFSIKVVHNGFFSNPPNRTYRLPTYIYVDYLDLDSFEHEDLQEIIERLGHTDDPYFYYYHHEEETLDVGFQHLQTRLDVADFLLKVSLNIFVVHTIYVKDYDPTVTVFYPKTLQTALIARITQLLDPYAKENENGDVNAARIFLRESYGVWIDHERVKEVLGKALDDLVGFQSDES